MSSQLDQAQPAVSSEAWIAPGAILIGDVSIGSASSIWYGAVVRADQEKISIGEQTNIQDGTVMHSDPGLPLVVGDRVSVGHGAILHGCLIGDDVLVGMGATILNGARVGHGSLIAAGALVLEGAEIPPRSLVAGVPGKVRRPTTDDEFASIVTNGRNYVALSSKYAAGHLGPRGEQ
jgi:carbonic anhydrase/acetyltransferase-like protein (isoleucine patch superfamily)